MIDLQKTQHNLLSAGYTPGILDGLWGRGTATALLAHQAQRPVNDAMLMALGRACADEFPKYGMLENKNRLSEWLAETGNETGGYTRFEENLHYSAKRLLQIWPSRFKTLQQAAPYAWDPSDPDREDVALANMVYGGRMGNQTNGIADNDGWDTRGGGLIQHTGMAEFNALRKIGITPQQIHGGDPAAMVRGCLDYWDRVKANSYCDRGDFDELRHRVNGGYIGLPEVAIRRKRSMSVIV
jgi:putative chitinase